MRADQVRKGDLVVVLGTTVLVAKREKWNPRRVKVSFADAGQGFPVERGTQIIAMFYNLDEEITTP